MVLVGDRGMITSKRIDESLRDVEGLDWITALRADSIQKLASQGLIQPSLFDERDLVEISSPDYPGERLVVCRNPLLADERARKRRELLAATEKKLEEIAAATRRSRRPLRSKEQIGLRVGKVLNHYKVGKHFQLEIEEQKFTYRRDETRIANEAALDGLYVIRTSVAEAALSSENTVRAYKDLAKVERAFRSMKTIDLHVRPIYHWLDERIKAHVFLCMFCVLRGVAHARTPGGDSFRRPRQGVGGSVRKSIVAPAPRSQAAKRKDLTKRTESDEPVHSFRSLLADLGTLCKNRVRLLSDPSAEFDLLTRPTPPQQQALGLLGVEIPM